MIQVRKLATQSRKRAVLMAEIVEKIKSVKMLCLEQPLAKRIKEIRNREIKRIGGSFFYSAVTYFLNFLVKISIFVCLVSFSNAGNRFNARNVYVVISYYNLMGYSVLKCWPRSVADAREAKAFIGKLQENLQSKDNIFTKFHLDEDVNVTDNSSEAIKLLKDRKNEQHSSNPGIFMRNVWLAMRSRNTFDLRCDYLELTERKIYVVEGLSNFAENLLLQIILGEIEVDSGEIEINGKISYASQILCVIPGTVRENILCGEVFDEERYKTIIEICKLRKDLEVMAAGDSSFIDESMKNTSFKAKINIARCLYRHADIYVFDDPFREIPLDTAKFIFENAMKKLLKVRKKSSDFPFTDFHNSDLLKLQHKMCIVATKHRRLLHEIDDVISMKNGLLCHETRTKSSKLEETFNLMSLNAIKVS